MDQFEIAPLGDCALLLRMSGEAPQRLPAREARDRIEAAAIPGVAETVIGFASVGVFFDPSAPVHAGAPIGAVSEWLAIRLKEALDSATARPERVSAATIVEIPVCYDAEFGIDLARVAQHAGASKADVIRLHSAAEYEVRCVGFTPGFPYLSGLPPELATPRHATPRKAVPAGAVAIGGMQAGVYPTTSPGGWNVIGRTPLQLFDLRRDVPALLRVGDQVRFRPMTRDEFAAASTQAR